MKTIQNKNNIFRWRHKCWAQRRKEKIFFVCFETDALVAYTSRKGKRKLDIIKTLEARRRKHTTVKYNKHYYQPLSCRGTHRNKYRFVKQLNNGINGVVLLISWKGTNTSKKQKRKLTCYVHVQNIFLIFLFFLFVLFWKKIKNSVLTKNQRKTCVTDLINW